jgi:hypothetical protein
MAVLGLPRLERFHDKRRDRLRWLRALGGRVSSYAPLQRLLEMPLTVLGIVCVDAAAVWWDPIVGLFSAGVLLVVLELLISDDGGSQ